MTVLRALARGLAAAALFGAATAVPAAVRILTFVPSAADPGVHDFDEPSYALTPDDGARDLPLVLFLPGTGGRPRNAVEFLGTAVEQGYRVLALEYDDEPSVSQICPRDPDPGCSEQFRAMRVDGTGDSKTVRNPPAEAIVPRLVAALKALDRADPASGWAGYLEGDTVRWERLVVSGLSQGAGMAAFITKSHPVRRVVLFSSPWDTAGSDRQPAPWLATPSATPADRWFAEYHAREATAPLIRQAYAALGIPAANLRVFDRDLPPNAGRAANPFHGSTIRDRRYVDEWRFLFGRADGSAP